MSLHISLAPFHGITGKIFRNAFTKHFPGYDVVFAPFVSGTGVLKVNPSKFKDVLPLEDNNVTTVPQFVSTEPKEIILMGNFLADKGFTHFNWNMGCPFPQLTSKKRGCGILPHPEIIRRILDETVNHLPLQMSVKTRLGLHSDEELMGIVEIFNDYPISEVVIHPRTGDQMYRGDVNIDKFEELLTLIKHKVTYNGDIYHATRLKQLQKKFPQISQWMLGRGALINPFLAAQAKGIVFNDHEKRYRLQCFFMEVAEKKQSHATSQKVVTGYLKSVLYYLKGLFSDKAQFYERLKVCDNTNDCLNLIFQLMDQPLASETEIENYFRKGLKHI